MNHLYNSSKTKVDPKPYELSYGKINNQNRVVYMSTLSCVKKSSFSLHYNVILQTKSKPDTLDIREIVCNKGKKNCMLDRQERHIQKILLNYVPHALCPLASSSFCVLRALRAFMPYTPSCLSGFVSYVPYTLYLRSLKPFQDGFVVH